MPPARPRRRPFSIGRWVLIATLVIDALAAGLAMGVYATVAPLVPDEASLSQYRPRETTKIYSADGQLLASLFEENRRVAELSEIPQWLICATIAIEDERFYEHPGVDLRGVARAIRENLTGRRQGGSTITQQLARDIFLTRDPTITRKLQEMTLALRIERRFSKEEILGLYLNQICYGHRAYGVVAAADTFFGKRLDQLTLGECALIAGLAKNPQGYSPIDNPERSTLRRNLVLSKMLELGFITQSQYDEARSEPIVTSDGKQERWRLRNYRAPWFTTYVIQKLVELYGHDKVYSGGLQVTTTIDLSLQSKAQETLKTGLKRLARHRANRGAAVCMDPNNGEILAMVGGTDFTENEFNSATQAHRQPGSSFKPIVYTTAMERFGLSPGDTYNATPATFRGYFGTYTPHNYSESQQGPMSVARALAVSCNVVAVRVILKTGPQHVVEQARRMGIDPDEKYLRAYPSLALGACEVTPLEMTVAYSAFANGGFHVEPVVVREIRDSAGTLIYRAAPKLKRVMSGRTAIQMNQMLQGVINSGTGRPARISSPAGGKTGTTNDAKDVWFIGFTPGICCAVWVGNESNRRMYGATGSGFCAPMWRQIVLTARELARKRGTPWPREFPRPGTDGPVLAPPATEDEVEIEEQEEQTEEEKPVPDVTAMDVASPGDLTAEPVPTPADRPEMLGSDQPPEITSSGPAPAPPEATEPAPELSLEPVRPEPMAPPHTSPSAPPPKSSPAPAPALKPVPKPAPMPAPAPTPAALPDNPPQPVDGE